MPLTLVLFQVPYTDCKNVPQQECKQVPQQQCQQEPYTASQQVRPTHIRSYFLQYFSDQVCEDVHRKIPQRISRTVPKKTCGGSGGGSGGFLPERQTSGGGGGGGYRFLDYSVLLCLGVNSVSSRSGSSSNELVFTGALGSNSGSNVKSAPQTRAGGDAINFG